MPTVKAEPPRRNSSPPSCTKLNNTQCSSHQVPPSVPVIQSPPPNLEELRYAKEMEDKVTSPEKAEEAKLKARYPHLGQKPGGSDFLRKRLQKGQKYFDSGDYNMAKAKMKNKQLPTAAPDKTEVTGDHIPTPQDLPQRKPSLVASKLAG
uniref:cAMP-regulated phosphoprotein 19 isoform X1 n=1 Tax=Nyctereutes procyonoides TaxID=34880 RepID=UPI002443B280|nr:cAMP-regulated phosphoprotein 19 isoform X1 [Nyctereutes procyonoides]